MKNNYDYNQFYAQANRKKVKSFVNIVLYFGKNVTTDTKEKPLQWFIELWWIILVSKYTLA